jgi:hypothetical protein
VRIVNPFRPARAKGRLLSTLSLWLSGLVVAASAGAVAAPHYTLEATQSCLKRARLPSLSAVNHSLPGSGGNLEVFVRAGTRDVFKPDSYNVFIVFGRDATDAYRIRKHAVDLTMESFAAQSVTYTRHYVLDGVELKGNVFYYSAQGPLTADERTKVNACLR